MAVAYATVRATVRLGGTRDSSDEGRPSPITSARLGSARRHASRVDRRPPVSLTAANGALLLQTLVSPSLLGLISCRPRDTPSRAKPHGSEGSTPRRRQPKTPNDSGVDPA
jgi:hypothetical protein